ncbi:MAG: hypothetical protein ACPHID_03145 [Thermoplasmatota archaeon]
MRLLWLVCLLALTASVAAQAPEGATVTVTPGTAASASLDEAGSAEFTVRFDSQNPIDAQQARSLRLSVSGAADGWTYQLDTTDLELTAGSESRVTVRVAVSGDAEAESSTVTLLAQLVPQGLNAVPTVGPLLDPAAEGTGSVTVERDDSTTRQVLEVLGPWVYVIAAALIIAVIVLVKVMADARRTLVALETREGPVTIKPGQSIAIPVTVRNLGRTEDTVVFHVMTVAQGWAASLPLPELDLDAEQEEELQLIVHAPEDATSGSEQTIGVTAHSAAAPKRVAEAVITVHVA